MTEEEAIAVLIGAPPKIDTPAENAYIDWLEHTFPQPYPRDSREYNEHIRRAFLAGYMVMQKREQNRMIRKITQILDSE